MKQLLVKYEKEIKDKNRDSYIKAIEKEIPTAKIESIEGEEAITECDALLVLEPLSQQNRAAYNYSLRQRPYLDIEGVQSEQLTITAEAILRTIYQHAGYDLDDKTILIINQSEHLGAPLAKALIDNGANAISANSKYKSLENLLALTDIDILVSATGDSSFSIEKYLTRNIFLIIDLSCDTEDARRITRIPTVKVLKERLENW
ncbi:hypothetical protein KQI68_06805 [Peptoniphilus sp. MSJ-1]|uniref:Tetrahydrofolate dehydrogenase/cyclohydrolase NAD(P)-binding domain-containing protein n=1 Tax=Peptoniphilus ovalis TaxID=2841503 RepID=A0ABS6FHA0_9FIRM|nr:hypothetical protein [Peptoniphilus ovalis]MBU5669548.1 hypothetical protein [Peptoniphilus ovalis]